MSYVLQPTTSKAIGVYCLFHQSVVRRSSLQEDYCGLESTESSLDSTL